MAERKGPSVAPLPPRTQARCPHGHITRTRLPAGSQLPCGTCGQEGRIVMVTVPAALPAIRTEPPPSPAGIDLINKRRVGPERWYCSCCQGSTVTPGPGLPPIGWIAVQVGEVLAGHSGSKAVLAVRACSVECLARLLPALKDRLSDQPWQRPEPGPGGNVATLMKEVPGRRY
jgi:hypothetical protein